MSFTDKELKQDLGIKQRGGSRPNSGRKKGIETKTIAFRVPTDKEQEYKSHLTYLFNSLKELDKLGILSVK